MTDEEREDLNTFKHDLIKQARWWQWKAETLEKEKEQLKSENDALRERLEKAVERLKARELSVCFGWEWKAVVTDEDIEEVFGVTESSLEEPEGGKE